MPDPTAIPPEPEPRGLARLKAEGQGQHPVVVRNVDDALRLGEIFVRSGFFEDSRAVSQAVVKVLYGVELGLSPIVAMNSLDVVEGKVAPGAQLTASKIETHPLYDFRVIERTRERCEIEFYRRRDRLPDGEWELRGTVVWDEETAKAAGLLPAHAKSSWTKYPQAMLYARAITEGARAYCPDLFHGIAAYSAEELQGGGDPVEPFDLTPPPPPPAPPAPPAAPSDDEGDGLEGTVEHPADDGEPAPAGEPAEVEPVEEPAVAEDPDADAAYAEAQAAEAQRAQQPLETPESAPEEPQPAAEEDTPTWYIDPAHLASLSPPDEGSRDAGRWQARALGFKAQVAKVGGDTEAVLVELGEELGLPGLWSLYDDAVFEVAKARVTAWCLAQVQAAAGQSAAA